MATASFAHLLSAGRIGSLTLKNRLVVTAMGASLAEHDGSVGERLLRYHEEQAKGGVGLIITGVAGVAWPVGGNQVDQLAISDDRFLPGLRRLVDSVHAHDGKIAFQLHHGGLVAMEDMLAGRPVWTPSLPEAPKGDFTDAFLLSELDAAPFRRITHVDFKVMTAADIAVVVRQFAAAAARAVEAGADGVEIHCGHGYLIQSFLSPVTNRRTDEYGGTLENRARFAREVLRAVRQAVGPGFPVWCKLDAEERGQPSGITVDLAIAAARLLETDGADAITVTAYHDAARGKLHSGSHTPHAPGENIPVAARIKSAIGIPVIASGRIEPEAGDKAIAEGSLDFVSMGRKILADPHLPQKLAEGRADEIRPCIYCYTCISAIYVCDHLRCAVNPETGFEHRQPPEPPHPTGRRRFVVVGGGPGGMEAARRLDEAGQEVILLEQAAQLGGTLRFASLAYAANEKLLDWLRDRLQASKVEIRLGTRATPALLRELKPDAVIVASGARRELPQIPGAGQDHVFSGDDMRRLMLGESSDALKKKTGWATRLAARLGAASGATANLDFVRKATHGWMPFGQDIVIIGGELVGLELAEFLAERGRTVTVVDDLPRLGGGLTIVRRMRLIDELVEHGVALHRGVSAVAIAADAVSFTAAEGTAHRVPADHVVVAKGASGDLALAETLRAAGFAVHTVGDCNGVGYIEGAIRGAADTVGTLLAERVRAVA